MSCSSLAFSLKNTHMSTKSICLSLVTAFAGPFFSIFCHCHTLIHVTLRRGRAQPPAPGPAARSTLRPFRACSTLQPPGAALLCQTWVRMAAGVLPGFFPEHSDDFFFFFNLIYPFFMLFASGFHIGERRRHFKQEEKTMPNPRSRSTKFSKKRILNNPIFFF